MVLRRALNVTLLAVLPIWAAAHAACAGKKGGLMLAINTDMKAPKDVNIVSVHIQTGSAVKHNFIGRVTPEGEVGLPATLAIAEPDDPSQSIRVRVVAFQENKPRVLRDVRTTVPRDGRIALLRIPLAFVNDGISVSGSLPDKFLPPKASGGPIGSGDAGAGLGGGGDELNPYDPTTSGFTPGCSDPDQTYIDGTCQDSFVDPATLPDFTEEAVFGQGGAGACFDAKKCFANAAPIGAAAVQNGGGAVDAGAGDLRPQPLPKTLTPRADRLDLTSCKITLDPGKDVSKLNLAMVTKDTGECLEPGKCFIPLDQGDRGWKVEGGAVVSLPPIVCTLVGKGIAQIYASVGTCGSKTPASPLCLDGATGTPPAPAQEQGISLVVPEGFVSALAVDGNRAIFAGGSGGAQTDLTTPSRQGISTVPGMNVPWIVTLGDPGNALFTNTSTATTYFERGDAAVTVPTTPINDVGLLRGEATYWATGSGGTGKVYGKRLGGAVNDLSTIPFVGTPTHVVVAQQTIAVVDDSGGLTGCALDGQGNVTTCPGRQVLGAGLKVDAIAVPSGALSTAYFTERGAGVRRLNIGPPVAVVPLTTDDTTGLQGEQYFRRQIATDGACVYYATSQGLFWVRGDGSAKGKIGDVPGKPILAVAVAPSANIYFAAYGDLNSGGGIYRASKPKECNGVDTGGGTGGGIVDGGT